MVSTVRSAAVLRTTRICLIVAIPTIIGMGAPLLAEECSKEEMAKARPYYNDGAKAFRIGELRKAADAFKAAYEACPSPLFLYNLGQTYRQLKDNEKALYFYKQYLSTTSPIDERRGDVQKWIDQLNAQIENQRRLETPPLPSQPPTQTVPTKSLATGTAALTPAAVYRDVGRSKRLAGIIVADGGLALVALGVGFAVLSKQAGDAAYRPSSDVYDPSADDRQKNYRTADIACFVVGAAAVVGGTVLWLIGRRQRHQTVDAAAAGGSGFVSESVGVRF